MSFSGATRDELARVTGQRPCCRLAELAALCKMDGIIQIGNGQQVTLRVATGNAAVARKVFTLIKDIFGLQAEVTAQRQNRLAKSAVYQVHIPTQQGLDELLIQLGLVDKSGRLEEGVPENLVRRECCRRAFLRGAFLGGGSVNSPSGAYHLEIVTESARLSRHIGRLMQKTGLMARVSRRKNWHVVYLKDSEQIASFLNIAGAHSALLQFESARIYKDVRNAVNRLVNCETANLNKTVNASVRQLESIGLINETVGLGRLPPTLREMARLRLQHPDASLKELGDMTEPRLGKSGVNHRLRRLEEIAGEIKGGRT